MKKILIMLLLLISAPEISFAGDNPGVSFYGVGLGPGGAGGGGGDYCTSSTACNSPPSQCDIYCEDFEGSTSCDGSGDEYCRSAFYSTDTTGVTITFNASNTGSNLCAGTTDTGAIEFSITDAAPEGFARKDYTIATTQLHLQFYLTIDTEDLDDGEECQILVIWTSSPTIRIKVEQSSGSLYAGIYHSNDEGLGTTALSLDTMYRVNLDVDTDANTLALSIDGVDQGFTATYYAGVGSRLYLGPSDGLASDRYEGDGAMSYIIDNISLDDDTQPSACSE